MRILNSINQDNFCGDLHLDNYSKKNRCSSSIKKINILTIIENVVLDYLDLKDPIKMNKADFHICFKSYFGLGTEKKSLLQLEKEGVGNYRDLLKEIKQNCDQLFKIIVLGHNYTLQCNLNEKLKSYLLRFIKELDLQGCINKIELYKRIEKSVEIKDEKSMNLVLLLLKVFGYSQTTPALYKLRKNVFFFHKDFNKKMFFKHAVIVYKIIEESISPLSLEEIETRLKSQVKEMDDTSLVQLICSRLNDIEYLQKSKKYQIGIQHFVNKEAKIYRIIEQKDKILSRADIIKSYNEIPCFSENPIDETYFQGLLFKGRVCPIGRKGLYSLDKWNSNLETIPFLIRKAISKEKKALSSKEIYQKIINDYDRKDLTLRSLQAILCNKKFKFSRSDAKQYSM